MVPCAYKYAHFLFAADQVDGDEDIENVAALGLGELADLTVFNEADTSSYDVRMLSLAFWAVDDRS